MGNYKLGYKAIIVIFVIALVSASCSKNIKEDIYFALNEYGLIHPQETALELPLNKQPVEQVFAIKEFCTEDYDSIFVLPPYYYTKQTDFANLNMSYKLRSKCDYIVKFDTFSTILFMTKGKIKAYAVIKRSDADFATIDFEKQHLFPIEQQFILDKERNVHIYNK
ncbi:MAG: hypothetical protein IKL54_06630 [Bacteroidaceae bacterium]|nr:hypothetical protein [Bacteroidaceae bacterium]